ncbi:CREB/ATF bZIP transcription factor [Scyliorhinus canicula]|uniref:CREB/ATF bZIP transcription factor n=1 Tax=Scyliorhinus canicula TaxID=7830 RepID=UPI0018F5C560|nr:CREB/ATF bZIP transcription factor [Scyliorhinus canicula]
MSGSQSGPWERRLEEARSPDVSHNSQPGLELCFLGSSDLDLWDFNWDLVEVEDGDQDFSSLTDVPLRPPSPEKSYPLAASVAETIPITGPSDGTAADPQEQPSRHNSPARNRNAAATAARLNRLKKKEYVTGLEQRASGLQAENLQLRAENQRLSRRLDELQGEARYLRAVLANQSSLARLLNRLSGLDGMKLSSSLCRDAQAQDHDYAIPGKRLKSEEEDGAAGGVCLHVDQGHVSIEFCSSCAQSASSSLKMYFPAILDGWV